MAKPDSAEKPANDKLPDTGLPDTALSDAQLRAAYQAQKAEAPLPHATKQRIMRHAKQASANRNWRSWWYFSQLALGCAALVLVLSWVNPAKLPAYYQIDTVQLKDGQLDPGQTASGQTDASGGVVANNSAVTTVQWHHLTAATVGEQESGIARQRLQSLKAQQKQLLRAGELSSELHRQVGILTRHQDSWQIAMCDNMQLNVAIELVQQLTDMLQLDALPQPQLQPQWVELKFAPTGHILGIAALPSDRQAGQCPAV